MKTTRFIGALACLTFLMLKARVVCENEGFVALTPFWAVWPFETLVLPRRHFGAMDEMSGAEARGLADIWPRPATLRLGRPGGFPQPQKCFRPEAALENSGEKRGAVFNGAHGAGSR